VIVGRLIPAGTGMEYYRNVQLSPELEEAAAKIQAEVQTEHRAWKNFRAVDHPPPPPPLVRAGD
jgi:hypothetical protein